VPGGSCFFLRWSHAAHRTYRAPTPSFVRSAIAGVRRRILKLVVNLVVPALLPS
jgi:hypothetical protein